MMMRPGVLILLVVALARSAVAQQPALIRGRVIADENERPLRGARIAPTNPPPRISAAITDDEGTFELAIAQSAELIVSKAGFATMRIQRRSNAHTDDRPTEIRLSKGAAISGRVADEADIPAIAARVAAVPVDSRPAHPSSYVTQTDDRGEYRIGGLAPGRYTMLVNTLPISLGATDPATAQALGNLRFAPSAEEMRRPDGRTRAVTVQAGEERGGVDILLRPEPFTLVMQATRAAADSPAAAPSKNRIEGRVRASTGDPLGGAIVQATGRQPFNGVQVVGVVATTRTDSTGRFALDLPQDGEYRLQAGKPAYLATDPSPERVQIGKGVIPPPVELTLTPGGGIAGTIVDSAGEPFEGVRVTAMQVRRENGRVVATRGGWERVTDDRGRYRVFGLPAGPYIVMASTDASASGTDRDQRRGFTRTYYPGTARVDGAQLLQVQAGSDLTEIDLSVVPTVAARVSGTVTDSAGQPFTGRVQLGVSGQSGSIAVEPLVTAAESDGTFEFRDIPPGDYVVQAISEGRFGRAGEFGVASVVVADRDPPPAVVRTSPGVTLEGRFTAEGVERPPMRTLSLHAMTTDPDRGLASGRGPTGLAVHDDGRFYMTGLRGTVRFTVPDPPSGWFLKAMTIGGVEVTDAAYDFGTGDRTPGDAEVVLSASGATIKGTVTDRPQSRLQTCVALAFSTARQLWFSGSRHVKQSRTCGRDSFSIDGLPSGDYWVVAVERLEPGEWQIPDVLDGMVPTARRVTVVEGQTQSADLRVFRPSAVR
jgi:hypothetical protein